MTQSGSTDGTVKAQKTGSQEASLPQQPVNVPNGTLHAPVTGGTGTVIRGATPIIGGVNPATGVATPILGGTQILNIVNGGSIRLPVNVPLSLGSAGNGSNSVGGNIVQIRNGLGQFSGSSFTLGRGNELVLHAVDSLRFLVLGKEIKAIQGR